MHFSPFIVLQNITTLYVTQNPHAPYFRGIRHDTSVLSGQGFDPVSSAHQTRLSLHWYHNSFLRSDL